MTEKVTIELPEEVAQQVRTIAAHTQRSFEDVLLDWIRRIGAEPALELAPDNELMAICSAEPDAVEQDQLSDLLERNQDGPLSAVERSRLEELPAQRRLRHHRMAELVVAPRQTFLQEVANRFTVHVLHPVDKIDAVSFTVPQQLRLDVDGGISRKDSVRP